MSSRKSLGGDKPASTVGASARKGGSKIQTITVRDGATSDGERDGSGSPGQPVRRRATDSSDSATEEEEEVDVQASLLAPRKSGVKDNKPASAASTTSGRRTTRSASPAKAEKRKAGPASRVKAAAANKKTASSGTRSETSGKAPPKRSKKSKSTTASTGADDDTSDEEEAGVRTVRSTSARGYTWESEVIEMKPEEVKSRLVEHPQIKAKIERGGQMVKIKLKAGDRIFVLPDPAYLPPLSEEITIEELDDSDWWVATVERTLSLPQSGQHDLGVIEVRWMYSADDVLKLEDKQLHKHYKAKLKKYRMDSDERIDSDHLDYIGIDAYGGEADGIYNHLEMIGFEVPDVERMKPPHKRKLVKKPVLTEIKGFNRKAAHAAKLRREAKKAAAAGREPDAEEEEEQAAEEDSDANEVVATAARKSATKSATKKKPSSTASSSTRAKATAKKSTKSRR